jgi:hypothetical protein
MPKELVEVRQIGNRSNQNNKHNIFRN